ncbi:four-carbon acid sugar kinase family protein [Streptomyces sp. PT12]|uniref:four-carbon acid sugar kinase family protein n=1 Tax=Streptomyces sp. PT12 TaxID=1510197 RepID=UPI000DE2897C|nr:four-carbon acid sugar kinase family protein [Streptomyces sp. PT12]RBM20804.1 Hrp-dependent type III effector protein [Streptomyces sp. PT12]
MNSSNAPRAARTSGVLVVADDLTGANATAAGFARAGLRAVTAGPGCDADALAAFGARFDAVVVCTDSRHAPPADAATHVTDAIRTGWPASLVCNRIDSTLRGNVGATTAAALRAVRDLSGRWAVALCAPAHPGARRHTVQGSQLLDGVRLEETELAADPRSPVPTSDIAALLAAQAPHLATAALPLSAVTGDPDALRDRVATLLADGADVLIADALTTDHLRRSAAAAVAAGDAWAGSGGGAPVWLSVDPGPGSVALAGALGLARAGGGAPLLAVSGSTTRLTRDQLARLAAERPVRTVRPVPAGPGPLPDLAATAEALARALADAGPGETVLLATVIDGSDVVELTPADAAMLPAALAATVRDALERRRVDGLFATGGDMAAALLRALDVAGLAIEEELVPLAVAGTAVGGPWAGLPVVTKGGLVGDPATTVACLDHLARMATAAHRRVPAAQATRDTPGRNA